MMAILRVNVPFHLLLQEGAQYNTPSLQYGGYTIVFDVPTRSGRPLVPEAPEHVAMNDQPAFVADAIKLRFYRDSFDRRQDSDLDPPAEVITMALRSLLNRLKYVAQAYQVKMIEFPRCEWHLQYLNDDGSELVQQNGHVRGRGVGTWEFSTVMCDPVQWDLVFSLPHEFEPPEWSILLLDARDALPHIGSAVVLTATALEVFVAKTLEVLAQASAIPAPLWSWINDRGNWQKEPSVEEQFDVLLKILCGHSLKEENALWEAWKNLRAARNSFVHEGVPRIGRIALTAEGAQVLIVRAGEIMGKVREWLPEPNRWPVFKHEVKLEASKVLVRGEEPEGQAGADSAAR